MDRDPKRKVAVLTSGTFGGSGAGRESRRNRRGLFHPQVQSCRLSAVNNLYAPLRSFADFTVHFALQIELETPRTVSLH